MKIEPSELLPIGNEFQKIFGISFGKFIDMRFLLVRKELVFNLVTMRLSSESLVSEVLK